jgi:hypothetical protein
MQQIADWLEKLGTSDTAFEPSEAMRERLASVAARGEEGRAHFSKARKRKQGGYTAHTGIAWRCRAGL